MRLDALRFQALLRDGRDLSAAPGGYEDYQGAPLDLSPGQRTAALKMQMLPLARSQAEGIDKAGTASDAIITVSPMQH